MARRFAVGAIELSSIGVGCQVQDALMKAASSTILMARAISGGKYLIVYSGKPAEVEEAMEVAVKVGGEYTVDKLTVADVCQALFPALAHSVVLKPEDRKALGVIETKSVVSALIAGDFAGKAANVTLYRIKYAESLGGKGVLMLTGSLADVEAALEAARKALKDTDMIVSAVALSNPEPELFNEYL